MSILSFIVLVTGGMMFLAAFSVVCLTQVKALNSLPAIVITRHVLNEDESSIREVGLLTHERQQLGIAMPGTPLAAIPSVGSQTPSVGGEAPAPNTTAAATAVPAEAPARPRRQRKPRAKAAAATSLARSDAPSGESKAPELDPAAAEAEAAAAAAMVREEHFAAEAANGEGAAV